MFSSRCFNNEMRIASTTCKCNKKKNRRNKYDINKTNMNKNEYINFKEFSNLMKDIVKNKIETKSKYKSVTAKQKLRAKELKDEIQKHETKTRTDERSQLQSNANAENTAMAKRVPYPVYDGPLRCCSRGPARDDPFNVQRGVGTDRCRCWCYWQR